MKPDAEQASSRPSIAAILGAGGALERLSGGFEHRPGQVAMAEAVAATLDDGGVLLAEAGTGTGKSLAYLVPAALSGRLVVVSTATRALQDQLLEHDLPLVARLLGRPVRAAVLKGRQNYLCLYRLARFRPLTEAGGRIAEWATKTEVGDRAEVDGVPESASEWGALTVPSESCLGGACPDFERCFVTRARRRAAQSEVVVVNHHLYFGDLVVREAGGAVLPEHDAVVFDEAHAVPDVAGLFFGSSASSQRVDRLLRDAASVALDMGSPQDLRLALGALPGASAALFDAVRPAAAGREPWLPIEATPAQRAAHHRLDDALAAVGAALTAHLGSGADLAGLVRRADALRGDLALFFDPADQAHVYYREARDRSVTLARQPVEPAGHLQTSLHGRLRAAVFTSATLAVRGSFEYARGRLGIDPEQVSVREGAWESPFDYGAQARLYLPAGLPTPSDPRFPEAVAEQVRRLTALTRGRAFVLFTSYRNLNAVRELLDDLPWPLMAQGDAPRARLLERFRRTEGAVLLATSSFWEGVDVAGEALSLVVIDKLPFGAPNDPVLRARIEAAGSEAFRTLQLPAAAIALKQGFGRLVRTRKDRGIVAILDPRVQSRGYGKALLRALPAAPVEREVAALERWWTTVD